MKRITAIMLLFLFALSGCGSPLPSPSASPDTSPSASSDASTEPLQIICTIFPQYDWVRQILGEKAGGAELTLLLNSGIDLHSYQPSIDDMAKISNCDLFIYVGGESDGWVEDALKNAQNPDRIVVNLLEELGDAAKEEERKEGMETEPEEEEEGHAAEEEGEEYDEHVWLSLKNAQIFCSVIAESLSSLDAANSQAYRDNLAAYNGQLSALDARYKAAADAAPVKTLLFGDRFPFRYLTDDYGLDYYAAFIGCSAETEASITTITFLAEKTNELALKHIMVIESSDKSIANTIIECTTSKDQTILVLDSMQSVGSGYIEAGATYLSVMESNLGVLEEALT